VKIAREKRPEKASEISLSVVIPAFIISELKTAFQIGFMIYLPFFIIDMVVSSILLSMGMMMLPPIMMSMPFKLLLFVLVDGWYLIVGSLVASFR
jgi:flagellar biosynthetic protein FliP